VEGPILAVVQNVCKHRIKIVEHVTCRNSQLLKTGLRQSRIPTEVKFRLIPTVVDFSIDFNCKPLLKASKVENIALDRKLPPETESTRTLSQLLPEKHFRQRHLPAQLAGKADVVVCCADGSMFHTRTILPETGRWQPVRADGGVDSTASGPSTTQLR
jgi:hypothetical protein